MNKAEEAMPEMILTDDDLKEIKNLSESMNLADSALCLTYGTAAQKKLVSVSDKLFRLAADDDTAEIGVRMNELIRELRDFSSMQQCRGIFAWFFRKRDRKSLQKRYESAAANTDAIAAGLEQHRNRLLRDFVMLGKLYDAVLEQYHELTITVEAGQRKLDADASAGKDLRERFEKRLHDLRLSRMVCMQTLTQIRILQDCNTVLAEKIQSLLTNTLALWKNQTALALAVKDSGQAMEDLRKANGTMIGVLEDVCTAEKTARDEAGVLKEHIGAEENNS